MHRLVWLMSLCLGPHAIREWDASRTVRSPLALMVGILGVTRRISYCRRSLNSATHCPHIHWRKKSSTSAINIPTHTHIHTYTQTHIDTHTHIHTYTHTRIHTYTHTHKHTYTHTRIHTNTQTHIHTPGCPARIRVWASRAERTPWADPGGRAAAPTARPQSSKICWVNGGLD